MRALRTKGRLRVQRSSQGPSLCRDCANACALVAPLRERLSDPSPARSPEGDQPFCRPE
jgi:hypothetical protein